MTDTAAIIPDATALICERCGYILTGIPTGSACPECGTPVAESAPELRHPSPWEQHPTVGTFLKTSWDVLIRPAAFFRSLTTLDGLARPRLFAWIHWAIVSVVFSAVAFRHNSIGASSSWMGVFSGTRFWTKPMFYLLVVVTFVVISATTRFAVRLTAWEAAYRGYRIPFNSAMRALYFHAAHYLPVALGAMITVYGFAWLLETDRVAPTAMLRYVYIIAAEVIIGAGYLFKTYWIGMRNIMFANR